MFVFSISSYLLLSKSSKYFSLTKKNNFIFKNLIYINIIEIILSKGSFSLFTELFLLPLLLLAFIFNKNKIFNLFCISLGLIILTNSINNLHNEIKLNADLLSYTFDLFLFNIISLSSIPLILILLYLFEIESQFTRLSFFNKKIKYSWIFYTFIKLKLNPNKIDHLYVINNNLNSVNNFNDFKKIINDLNNSLNITLKINKYIKKIKKKSEIEFFKGDSTLEILFNNKFIINSSYLNFLDNPVLFSSKTKEDSMRKDLVITNSNIKFRKNLLIILVSIYNVLYNKKINIKRYIKKLNLESSEKALLIKILNNFKIKE